MQTLKCVVVGDGAVGKTCMLVSHTTGEFPGEYIPTVFDNYSKSIMYEDTMYNMQYWDTAGQEDYDRLRPLSYQDADVFILCYSVISKNSLKDIRIKWQPEIEKYSPKSGCILVGCKSDLRSDTKLDLSPEDFVALSEVQQLSIDIKAFTSLECSSLTGDNLPQVFDEAIKCCIETLEKKSNTTSCNCVLL